MQIERKNHSPGFDNREIVLITVLSRNMFLRASCVCLLAALSFAAGEFGSVRGGTGENSRRVFPAWAATMAIATKDPFIASMSRHSRSADPRLRWAGICAAWRTAPAEAPSWWLIGYFEDVPPHFDAG